MDLLIVILHREELLDEVLATLVEYELPDAVVVESRSGLELLERDLPIFAGLRSLIPGGIDFSRMVLSVIEREGVGRQVVSAIQALPREPTPAGEPANTALLVPMTQLVHF